MPCGRRNAALFVQIKTLERLQETIGQKLSNSHSAPFLALFRVAGRQKEALAGNGVLEQRHEPGEHNADHDLQQLNQPPGPLITNCAATGMWYTIKVRLAKSRPVPWLTVQCAPPAAAKAPCCARGLFLVPVGITHPVNLGAAVPGKLYTTEFEFDPSLLGEGQYFFYVDVFDGVLTQAVCLDKPVTEFAFEVTSGDLTMPEWAPGWGRIHFPPVKVLENGYDG